MKKRMPRDLKIHIRTIACLTLVFSAVLACKSKKNVELMNVAEREEDLVLLLQDAYFPTDSLLAEVVKDQKNLQKFFSKVNITRKPGLPVPEVDFDNYNVLIVCAGETNNGSFPKLIKAKEDTNQILLEIGETSPQNESKRKLTSYPFSVYQIAKTDKKLVFTKL